MTSAINAISIGQSTTPFVVVRFGTFLAAVPNVGVVDGVYILDSKFRVFTIFVST